jgi:hypothetical protein
MVQPNGAIETQHTFGQSLFARLHHQLVDKHRLVLPDAVGARRCRSCRSG